MREAKIKLLEDKSIDMKEYTIIGRLDSSITNRKSIDRIIKDEMPEWENHKQDIVVVDHKPDGVTESIEKGVILHLSGHTHNGQLFPINFITQMLYGETGALKKIKSTYTYISNGIGFWGPPYRIPYAPEIVVIDISKDTEK